MIDLDEYRSWDGVAMAELIRSRQVRPDELEAACRSLLDAAAELNAVGAVADPAVAGAPDPEAPFAGVPFAVKELLAVPGLPWTMGSRLMAQAEAGPPSLYLERLLAAGLRIVCATTSSEFGLLGSTETALHGTTQNPWGEGLSAGGSSGGSAAIVASGALPMAHASDGGGSIRYPAAMTGLFGFKPSAGRVEPVGPDLGGLTSLVHEHAITRTVRDSATLLAATERHGAAAVHRPIGTISGPSDRRLRFLVIERTLPGALPDPAVRTALERTARMLEELGHERVELPLEPVFDGAALSQGFFAAAAQTMTGVAAMVTPMLGRPPGPDELEPFTLELVEWGATLPPDVAATGQAAFAAATRNYLGLFSYADVVLSPTVTRPPWPIGTLAPGLGREELIARTEQLVGYTPIHNITGSPAMSVPLEQVDGLPLGMHLAAVPGDDATLLRLAFELEAAAPWVDRLPFRTGAAATMG